MYSVQMPRLRFFIYFIGGIPARTGIFSTGVGQRHPVNCTYGFVQHQQILCGAHSAGH